MTDSSGHREKARRVGKEEEQSTPTVRHKKRRTSGITGGSTGSTKKKQGTAIASPAGGVSSNPPTSTAGAGTAATPAATPPAAVQKTQRKEAVAAAGSVHTTQELATDAQTKQSAGDVDNQQEMTTATPACVPSNPRTTSGSGGGGGGAVVVVQKAKQSDAGAAGSVHTTQGTTTDRASAQLKQPAVAGSALAVGNQQDKTMVVHKDKDEVMSVGLFFAGKTPRADTADASATASSPASSHKKKKQRTMTASASTPTSKQRAVTASASTSISKQQAVTEGIVPWEQKEQSAPGARPTSSTSETATATGELAPPLPPQPNKPKSGFKRGNPPVKPKKGMTGFLIYCQEKRMEMIDILMAKGCEPEDLNNQGDRPKSTVVAKELGAVWNVMSAEDKAPFIAMADASKAKANKRMAKYLKKLKAYEDEFGHPDDATCTHDDDELGYVDLNDAPFSDDDLVDDADRSIAHNQQQSTVTASGSTPTDQQRATTAEGTGVTPNVRVVHDLEIDTSSAQNEPPAATAASVEAVAAGITPKTTPRPSAVVCDSAQSSRSPVVDLTSGGWSDSDDSRHGAHDHDVTAMGGVSSPTKTTFDAGSRELSDVSKHSGRSVTSQQTPRTGATTTATLTPERSTEGSLPSVAAATSNTGRHKTTNKNSPGASSAARSAPSSAPKRVVVFDLTSNTTGNEPSSASSCGRAASAAEYAAMQRGSGSGSSSNNRLLRSPRRAAAGGAGAGVVAAHNLAAYLWEGLRVPQCPRPPSKFEPCAEPVRGERPIETYVRNYFIANKITEQHAAAHNYWAHVISKVSIDEGVNDGRGYNPTLVYDLVGQVHFNWRRSAQRGRRGTRQAAVVTPGAKTPHTQAAPRAQKTTPRSAQSLEDEWRYAEMDMDQSMRAWFPPNETKKFESGKLGVRAFLLLRLIMSGLECLEDAVGHVQDNVSKEVFPDKIALVRHLHMETMVLHVGYSPKRKSCMREEVKQILTKFEADRVAFNTTQLNKDNNSGDGGNGGGGDETWGFKAAYWQGECAIDRDEAKLAKKAVRLLSKYYEAHWKKKND
jgi:hypothetical protein